MDKEQNTNKDGLIRQSVSDEVCGKDCMDSFNDSDISSASLEVISLKSIQIHLSDYSIKKDGDINHLDLGVWEEMQCPSIKKTNGVLIDTGLILDILLSRDTQANSVLDPYIQYLRYLQKCEVRLYVTSLCVGKIRFYFGISNERIAEDVIIYLEQEFNVSVIDVSEVEINALKQSTSDNLDCFVEEIVASRENLDAIITLSPALYRGNLFPLLSIDKLLQFDEDICLKTNKTCPLIFSENLTIDTLFFSPLGNGKSTQGFRAESTQFEEINHLIIASDEKIDEKPKRVLLDASLITDIFLYRDIYAGKIDKLLNYLQLRPEKSLNLYVTDLGLDKLRFYLGTNNLQAPEEAIIWLEKNFQIKVIYIGGLDVYEARNLPYDDFDCAVEVVKLRKTKLDAIVTLSPEIYAGTGIPVLLIDDPIELFSGGNYVGQSLAGRDFSGQNLSRINLSGANLEGASLSNTDLSGADLKGANLRGAVLCQANLERADLEGAYLCNAKLMRANLRGAKLQKAKLNNANLSNADLIGANLIDAELKRATLRGATLNNSVMKRANLEGASLEPDHQNVNCVTQMICVKLAGANLRGAKLHRIVARRTNFRDADLQGADLSDSKLLNTNFEGANLRGANFSNADMGGAILTNASMISAQLPCALLRGASLKDADLSEANLEKSGLQGAYFKGVKFCNARLSNCQARRANFNDADLQGTNLEYAELLNASFERANLNNAKLKSAKLEGAIFIQASLIEADLSWAVLRGSDLKKANLKGANLTRAELQAAYLKCTNLSEANLTYANLNRARLKRANLTRADLSNAKLKGVDLRCANLQDAVLHGVHIEDSNLSGANLTKATLRESKLIRTNLLYTNFAYTDVTKSDLSGANLSDANMHHAKFMDTKLVGSKFAGTNLEYADFTDANLCRANLSDVDLTGTIFIGAKLNRSCLAGANLNSAILTGAQLAGANLLGAYLVNSDLRHAYLCSSYLRYVDFTGAKLECVDWNLADTTGAILTEMGNEKYQDSSEEEEFYVQDRDERLSDAQDAMERFLEIILRIEDVKLGFTSKAPYKDNMPVIWQLAQYIETAKRMELIYRGKLERLSDGVLLVTHLRPDKFQYFLREISEFINTISRCTRTLAGLYLKPYDLIVFDSNGEILECLPCLDVPKK